MHCRSNWVTCQEKSHTRRYISYIERERGKTERWQSQSIKALLQNAPNDFGTMWLGWLRPSVSIQVCHGLSKAVAPQKSHSLVCSTKKSSSSAKMWRNQNLWSFVSWFVHHFKYAGQTCTHRRLNECSSWHAWTSSLSLPKDRGHELNMSCHVFFISLAHSRSRKTH